MSMPFKLPGLRDRSVEFSGISLQLAVGVLHDTKEDDPVLYGEKIDEVSEDLLPKSRIS